MVKSTIKRTILGLVGPQLAASMRVVDAQRLSEHFYHILVEAGGQPMSGPDTIDKLQVNTGGWNMRTYTPIGPGSPSGSLRLLVYVHGDGPGARWVRDVRAGDTVHARGPKAILPPVQHPCLLVGDETSLATALHLQERPGFSSILEVTHPAETEALLAQSGAKSVAVIARKPGDAHRAEMSERTASLLQALPDAHLIFTGHAQCIQQVGRALRARGLRPPTQTKPHWADGKEGLD